MKTLRIIFCILACVCAAAAVPIGILFEWWCIIPVAGAIAFTLAMFMAKNASSPKEDKIEVDFMNTDEENEKIRREQNNREDK